MQIHGPITQIEELDTTEEQTAVSSGNSSKPNLAISSSRANGSERKLTAVSLKVWHTNTLSTRLPWLARMAMAKLLAPLHRTRRFVFDNTDQPTNSRPSIYAICIVVCPSRHGEHLDYVTWDARGNWVANHPTHLYDSSLPDHGQKQARQLGIHLASTKVRQHWGRNLPLILAIYSSSFLWCRQTAMVWWWPMMLPNNNRQYTQLLVWVKLGLAESFNEQWYHSWSLPGADGTWGNRPLGTKFSNWVQGAMYWICIGTHNSSKEWTTWMIPRHGRYCLVGSLKLHGDGRFVWCRLVYLTNIGDLCWSSGTSGLDESSQLSSHCGCFCMIQEREKIVNQ